MAQLLSDIKTSIGNAYISQQSVQIAYGFSVVDVSTGFDALFSKVSIESLLFYAIAFAIWSFECILDLFQTEIQNTVTASYIANKAWWHAQAMSFQKGYSLIMNATTFIYSYATIDATAQIITRCAVRENTDTGTGVCKVQLYVATGASGSISALTTSDASVFEAYANTIKPAGVLIQVISGAGDVLDFGVTVNYNPLVLDSTGLLISDGVTYPVKEAISSFIDNLNNNDFGGNLNLTKLIDSIQAATGVVDVEITSFAINTVTKQTWGTFASTNGWFLLGTIIPTYQPQI
jgi:hypothetical protein